MNVVNGVAHWSSVIASRILILTMKEPLLRKVTLHSISSDTSFRESHSLAHDNLSMLTFESRNSNTVQGVQKKTATFQDADI